MHALSLGQLGMIAGLSGSNTINISNASSNEKKTSEAEYFDRYFDICKTRDPDC